MKKKSAQLFDGVEQDANLDNVQLTVNNDFARKLQVPPIHAAYLTAILPGSGHHITAVDLCIVLQHNKQREELHRLQKRHPEVAAKAALHGTGRQLPEEAGLEVESSEEEDEVSQTLYLSFV